MKDFGDSSAATFQIQLEAAFLCRLGQLWDNNTLTGTFWRLYRNSSAGAGVFISGKIYPIMPGKYYLLPPRCDLTTWCKNPDIEQLFIHFNLPAAGGNAPIFALDADPALDELAKRLSDAISSNSSAMPLCALALASLAATRLPADAFSLQQTDFVIEKVCAYLRVNLQKQIGVGDMAHFVNLDPAEFSRRFRSYTGHTPYQYLSLLRYERAERLLRSGKYAIDEVCERVGINDRFHFSRCFKRRFGHPPARYRALGNPESAAALECSIDGEEV